ncbi:hypothetical protein XU18_2895 [Perkinsela sp. CCAP 1560/4]|nr:hypothetical protein XU18_2895 [Perkinsela sp. CCAP 1560/4]|eukprot:KNH06390.1 hypothetical protein XU18_2895 [Perkinsela sp. CCAP 1560/4]
MIGSSQRSKLNQLLSRLSIGSSAWKDWKLLSPLATSHFSFDELRLFTFGDMIIQREVGCYIDTYCDENKLWKCPPMLTNACAACFLNPLNMQRIAEENGLLELRQDFPLADRADAESAKDLFYSTEPPPALRTEDVRGTSFQFRPHDFCQDRLSLRLAHFIAAVEIDQGEDKAREVTRKLFRLDDTSPFLRAIGSLAETITFSRKPGNVSLGVLSAMGIQPLWEVSVDADEPQVAGREIGIERDDTIHSPESSTAGSILRYSPEEYDRNIRLSSQARETDSVLTRKGVVAVLHSILEGSSGHPIAEAQHDARTYTEGLDVSSNPFAEDYFTSGKRKFPKTSEQQHSFYETDRDIQRGVQFDTKGKDAQGFIESFRTPQKRVFTVRVKAHTTGNVIAMAQSTSFITARAEALERILLLIAHDLQNVKIIGDQHAAHAKWNTARLCVETDECQ